MYNQDDATNIPVGLAAVCLNTDFTATSADTRAGVNRTMQGVNKAPITGVLGLQYEPETATDVFFQRPLAFDLKGALQYEKVLGSGDLVPVPAGLFVPPVGTHLIGTAAANKAWMAFSNLKTPSSGLGVLDTKLLTLDPYGMKPVGWTWLPGQPVLVGEMATPTVQGGNGHTYRCVQAGVTGVAEPVWPVVENGQVADGTAEWEEYTMVLANRIPAPEVPVLALVAGGTFAAGQTVSVLLTFTNPQGETVGSAVASVTTTATDQAVSVTLPALASLPGWVRNLPGTVGAQYAVTGATIYEADVAAGDAAPAPSEFQRVGNFALGTTQVVTETATSGTTMPGANTARITAGQLPNPVDEPVLARSGGAGTFAAGRDVYVRLTYTNALGETTPGPSNFIEGTILDDGITVSIVGLPLYPQIEGIRVYEADVATGADEPAIGEYVLVGTYTAGDTATITTTAAGSAPPTVNTTGPGGNIVADTETGGANGAQGMRYGALMFMNRGETVSGFTQASVVSCVVDEDGWELAAFNVASGPANVLGRYLALTVADGTQAGPFFSIGLVNLQVPTQNFVYPQTKPSDGIAMSSTVFLDNVRTFGVFNFTDEYLEASNSMTDRLRVIWPPQAVSIRYLKSVNRMALTGIAGNYSGLMISLGADYESFYGDTSGVPIYQSELGRSWGTIEYRGVIYLLRERGGMTVTPTTNDPATWNATERWDKTGPCGPRAFDACSKFMIYVHKSGIYRYVDTEPDLMTKEIPRWWATINWQAAETISVTIDEDTHTVRMLFPVGGSMVPNRELVLSYIEGWQDPVHFSTYSGKEISLDACRRYSENDVQAFVCARIQRTLPVPAGTEPEGESDAPPLDGSFYTSQLVYGTSGPDGGIHARTPGIFNDNGAGIDWRYRTASAGAMLGLSKIEGFTLNATGDGTINASFFAARDMKTDWHPAGKSRELRVRPFDLSIDQQAGISRKVPSKLNEYWGLEFNNGKRPDVWCSLKFLKVYTIPTFDSREEDES